jgi:glycosyltransferase involved in cell wall biosynthesis
VSTLDMTLDIMLPYYGDVDLMKLAVRSVVAQSDPRWRLTVVDDGTAAGVPEWFAELGHPQVRYQRNERNLGLTANFQKCLDLAEHDNMVMMGCDDVMLPSYVATVLELLQRHPDATIVQPGVEVIGTDGTPVRTLADEVKRRLYAPKVSGVLALRGEELAASLLRGDWLYFPSLCWRTKEIKSVGFDSRLSVIQDLSLILHLVEQGGELVVTRERCFQYRRHAVSASSAAAVTGSRFTEAEEFFAEAAARMTARGWPRAARAARWHVSSRLHAVTMMPAAARQRSAAGLRVLAGYAFGPPRR